MLSTYGYPFKSKEHSHNVHIYQTSGKTDFIKKYLGETNEDVFRPCPKKLKYQFTPEFTLKIDRKCCEKLKKEPFTIYEKESGKTIGITGMRREEGGQRRGLNCTVFKGDDLKTFSPLAVCDENFMNTFIETYNIQLCELYYAPYNFKRTGCKGCPYSKEINKQLEIMKELLPEEEKQCEIIWKPVYDEYRRVGYRLRKE